MTTTHPIHHITAICGDPPANVRFHTRMLGLRLVKRTVNFDDPGTWHLYYGDAAGRPGSIITHFPWLHLPKGRPRSGQVVAVAYRAPAGTLGWWHEHLKREGVV